MKEETADDVYDKLASSNDGLYDYTHHGQDETMIYDTLAQKDVTEVYDKLPTISSNIDSYNHTHHEYSDTPTYDTLAKKKTTDDYDKTQDAGIVYSAVIRQDGKKTSVKITVE